MAQPWQYTFEFCPREAVTEGQREIHPLGWDTDRNLPIYPEFPRPCLPSDYAARLDLVLPRRKQPSTGFGHEFWRTDTVDFGDAFEVITCERKEIDVVAGYFDITHVNLAFVRLLVAMASESQSVLLHHDSNTIHITEPRLDSLRQSVFNVMPSRFLNTVCEVRGNVLRVRDSRA